MFFILQSFCVIYFARQIPTVSGCSLFLPNSNLQARKPQKTTPIHSVYFVVSGTNGAMALTIQFEYCLRLMKVNVFGFCVV